MRKLISRLATRAELWLLKGAEVARFEGIVLADLRNRKNRTPHFRDIILAALTLLKDTDPRRFERVRRRMRWIVRHTLWRRGTAGYYRRTEACHIDFLEPSAEYRREFLIGWYASLLVHEATHAELYVRGIPYSPELRVRIERLCVREQQRFVTRLTLTQPDLADQLYQQFDPAQWDWYWKATRNELFFTQMKRIFQNR